MILSLNHSVFESCDNFRGKSQMRIQLGILLLIAAIPNSSSLANDEPKTRKLEEYDQSITDDDRTHWSYLPVRRPKLPDVNNESWIRNPIDRFVLSRLEKKGWKPAAKLSRRALLRRAHLDLIGFPPELDEQQQFVDDTSPNAFERVVDSLLSRSNYGERWGRHWLDLVRYAETNGYERDGEKPHVWRYRDYVIRAFNDDRRYDRFILEQLAGDELPDRSTQTVIGTGFYRLGPWDDEPADPAQDRTDQLDDMIRTTSQTFLGLTLGCARCHDHKFDAITVHDYYRMYAVFDPLKRVQSGRGDLDAPAGSRQQLAAQAERDQQIGKLNGQIAKLRNSFRTEFLKTGRSKLPGEFVTAFLTPADKRSAEQTTLVAKHEAEFAKEVDATIPQATQTTISNLHQQVGELRRKTPDLPRGYFMQEEGPIPDTTYLLLRGRATQRGPAVEPGMLAVLAKQQPNLLAADEYTSRRRLSLARWIARRDNPLMPRVIVNRVWQYHFGQGLVRTSSDFGTLGSAPNYPELLNWLADWFINEGGMSLKKLHRLVMSSSTYRMSNRWNDEYGPQDPDNEFLWRFPYRRLEVEAIRDSMLAVSGQLNHKMYGPPTYLSVPKEALEGHSDPDKIWKPLNETEASRRTVYALVKRSLVVPMLEVLDLCDTTQPTEIRNVTSVAPQALTLFNGEFANRQARHFANRLEREVGDDTAKQIERAWLLALCRRPSKTELAAMQEYMQAELRKHRQESTKTSDKNARHHTLVQLCRIILNLNEFVYHN